MQILFSQAFIRVTYEIVNPVILLSGYDKNIDEVFIQLVDFVNEFEFVDCGHFHAHLRGLLSAYIGIMKRKCASL